MLTRSLLKADLRHLFPAVQWIMVITTGLTEGGGSYGRHSSETGHSIRWSGYPIVDEWFFAERTAVDELKYWHNYIAGHAFSENNPEKSECQKGLSRFGKT